MISVQRGVSDVQPEPFDDDDVLDRVLRPFPDGSPVFGLDDAPGIPTLPFAEWIELQASALRSHGTEAAAWLAGRIDALAELARYHQAATPDEFEAREELARDAELAREFDRGMSWAGGYPDLLS